MPRIQFDPKISWGHIAQLIALIVGLTAGYFDLAGRIKIMELTLHARIEANTARIEAQGGMLTQRLDWIGQTLEQMRADLEAARQQPYQRP